MTFSLMYLVLQFHMMEFIIKWPTLTYHSVDTDKSPDCVLSVAVLLFMRICEAVKGARWQPADSG